MDKQRPSLRKTIFLSIVALLVLSVLAHYASDTFSPTLRTEASGTLAGAAEGAAMTIDAQVYHALHASLMLAELIALGVLIGLTYAIIQPQIPRFPSTRSSPNHRALFILIGVASHMYSHVLENGRPFRDGLTWDIVKQETVRNDGNNE